MRLLIDTDAFCLLSVYDLLDEVRKRLNLDISQCFRIAALPYMLKRGKLREKLGDELSDRLAGIVRLYPEIETVENTWIDRFAQVPNIDAGEAQIFAIAACDPEAIVITNDKRSLKALLQVAGSTDALNGKILTIEEVLLSLCATLSIEEVRGKIAQHSDLDKMVQICFSPLNPNPIEGLQSYRDSLQTELVPLALMNL